jgi:hypothetical protein
MIDPKGCPMKIIMGILKPSGPLTKIVQCKEALAAASHEFAHLTRNVCKVYVGRQIKQMRQHNTPSKESVGIY